jgi:hypothetical protein
LKKAILSILGILCLIYVIGNVSIWIYISGNNSKTFLEARQEYLEVFPTFLQNAIILTGIAILFSLIAAYCFWQIKKNTQKQSTKKILTIAISIALLFAFWHLWSLM